MCETGGGNARTGLVTSLFYTYNLTANQNRTLCLQICKSTVCYLFRCSVFVGGVRLGVWGVVLVVNPVFLNLNCHVIGRVVEGLEGLKVLCSY